jgi:hypothetical protein
MIPVGMEFMHALFSSTLFKPPNKVRIHALFERKHCCPEQHTSSQIRHQESSNINLGWWP